MSPLPPRVAVAALLGTLLVAGLWPYYEILGWLPWGADASKWVGYGSLDNPNWWRWATQSGHFVGYRPVTALSFVGNAATTGYAAFGYRATDLVLHLLSGALLFVAYRRLTGDRSAFSLIPVFVLFVHPATEEVVPYVARRSYLLALPFALGALLAFLEALEAGRRRWAWAVGAAVLLGLAVLSNEVAYVFVPLLAMLALHRPRSEWRSSLVRALPALLVTFLAIVARYQVLGTFGGYQRRLFAFVQFGGPGSQPGKGTPMWRELLQWDPRRIATACWSYTLDPTGVAGNQPLVPGPAALVFVGVVTLWLGWIGVVRPLLRIRDSKERIPLLFTAWVLGALAIVVLSQTWFWRQAHGLLAPLGMLIAIGLRSAVEDLRAHPFREGPSLVVGLGALLAVSWNGPLWTGLDRRPHINTIEGTPIVRRIEGLLGQVRGPATVYLVAPMRGNAAHIVRLWGDRYGRKDRIEFKLLGHLRPNATPSAAELELKRDAVPPQLFLRRGLMFAQVQAIQTLKPAQGLPIDRLWRPQGGRTTWLFALDADEGWAIRVPRPPPGVKVIPDLPETDLPDDEG